MTNTGECSDEHQALASEAPKTGLQPSAVDPFREAEGVWTFEMKSAAMRDAENVCKLYNALMALRNQIIGWNDDYQIETLSAELAQADRVLAACKSDTHPKGGDASLAAPFMSGAVGEADLPIETLKAQLKEAREIITVLTRENPWVAHEHRDAMLKGAAFLTATETKE
jgi:hypothetical protein